MVNSETREASVFFPAVVNYTQIKFFKVKKIFIFLFSVLFVQIGAAQKEVVVKKEGTEERCASANKYG